MAFRPARALAVFSKDWAELTKNRALLASMAVLPMVFVLVPTGMVWAYAGSANDPSRERQCKASSPTISGLP